MKTLLGFFPLSAGATSTKGLVISIIAYFVAAFVAGFVIGILSKVPVINIVAGIVGSLLGLYTLVGIILAVLIFFKKLVL